MLQDYDGKSASYFSTARVEIEPLLPAFSARVLELGCGSGQTMRWLRETGRAGQGWGVELFEQPATRARTHFEDVLVGDAESLVERAFDGKQFDLILCLDVLEHMIDPWRCIETLQHRLAPEGKLVISVPNVRCLRVLAPLVLRGEWSYGEEGILDRTHLRFFTRESAQALASGTELRVELCLAHRTADSKLAMLNRWTLGRLDDLTAVQYLISASHAPLPRPLSGPAP
ncbi:class I SAM-dependent methyltransferase [Variovorax paradoxus]|nr:class I SAM-dependent methyltransferase [Variovorax paradoxus]